LICLLDRPPEELAPYNRDHPDSSGIVLSQPPHQQRFSFGYAYVPTTNSFEFKLRHLYTENPPDAEWPGWDHSTQVPPNQPEKLAASQIDPTTRVLKTTALAAAVNHGIQQQVGGDPIRPTTAYIDYVPNSAELALELNDPAYYFTVYPDQPYVSRNTTQRKRKLWSKPASSSTSTAQGGTTGTDTGAGKSSTTPAPVSDGFKPPAQPASPKGPLPAIPSQIPAPGKAIVVPFTKSGPPINTGSLPPNMMPIKSFTMDVFVNSKGLKLRQNGVYEPSDYVPTGGLYLIGMCCSYAVRRFMLNYSRSRILDPERN
jgi:hypothetical protein